MFKQITIAAASGIILSSCSVGMALYGAERPDLGSLSIGKTRNEIEMHLGSPDKIGILEKDKRTDVYSYQIGNEPSAGRAIGHAVMDVLTFGAWEIIGTPIEGFMGDKYNAYITYNKKDIVTNIKTTKISEGK